MRIQWHCMLLKKITIFQKKLVFRFLQIYCLAWVFWNIMHQSFGKCRFTELCRSFKCCHISLYSIKKSHSFTSPEISKEKFFSFRCWTEIFQNFDLKVWILSLATNTVTAVFYKVTGTICSFLRKWLSSIRIWIVCLWIILSRKTDIPWKKNG